ncbi:helix-turn-helix domain-containing protein [Streptomyces sp. NPDC051173]|uniref:helix-turn-helix domain-containing protein n=1 Tax=Streptomyces sp. NPDC051173 TaxID=3155164 RepID=UPI00344BC45D
MASIGADDAGQDREGDTTSRCACKAQPREWPEVLTARETAEYLRLDYQLVMRMTRAGDLPSLKAGRTWRYHRRALEQAMGADAIRR